MLFSTFLWPVQRGSCNATQKESSVKEVAVDGVLWQGNAEALRYTSAAETHCIKWAFTCVLSAHSCRLKGSASIAIRFTEDTETSGSSLEEREKLRFNKVAKRWAKKTYQVPLSAQEKVGVSWVLCQQSFISFTSGTKQPDWAAKPTPTLCYWNNIITATGQKK